MSSPEEQPFLQQESETERLVIEKVGDLRPAEPGAASRFFTARLGRRVAIDNRDAQFSAARALTLVKRLAGEARPLRSKHWPHPMAMDQGTDPTCVQYGWQMRMESAPVRNLWPFNSWAQNGSPQFAHPQGNWFYEECKRRDEFAGEAYDGTSVRAGAKVLKAFGFLSTYLWAWKVETVVEWLLRAGPVVMGTSWMSTMWDTTRFDRAGDPVLGAKDHWLRVGGRVEGGHCYVLKGVNLDMECPFCAKYGAVRGINSWGIGWGDRGKFWLCLHCGLRPLLADWGEACMPTEIKPVQLTDALWAGVAVPTPPPTTSVVVPEQTVDTVAGIRAALTLLYNDTSLSEDARRRAIEAVGVDVSSMLAGFHASNGLSGQPLSARQDASVATKEVMLGRLPGDHPEHRP